MITMWRSNWNVRLRGAPSLTLRLVWLLVAVLSCSGVWAQAWQVYATLDPLSEHFTLRWCKAGVAGSPLELRADDVLAMQLLGGVQPQPDRRGRSTLFWNKLTGDCVSLDYDLGAIADARRSGIGYRVGSDLLSWAWTWWWRPSDARRTPIALQLELPQGWRASAPWPQCGAQCWLIGATPPQWPALLVLGKFPLVRSSLPGGVIETALLGELSVAQRKKLEVVAHDAVDYLHAAYGRLPVPKLQLLIVPTARSGDAVNFGQLLRGGLGGMNLFVNPNAPAAEFARHWVLPHELAHLLHPYLGEGRGRWLAEGLASYYQNLLRGRSGRLSAEGAWEQLLQGFARGQRDVHAQTLDQLAGNMRDRGAFMRVYWSGAAFWLLADLQLRQRGNQGLDQVLETFALTHLPADQKWAPEQFLSALDAQLPRALFVPLAQRVGADTQFPNLQDALLSLDLDPTRPVRDPVAKARARVLRAAIMGPSAGSTAPAAALETARNTGADQSARPQRSGPGSR
jgi:hypothetical protein